MGLKEFAKKVISPEEIEEIDDEKTQDRYLRFLRRENRRIDEKYEKERLRNRIKQEDTRNLQKNVFGFGEKKILKTENVFNQKFKFEEPKKETEHILKQKNIFKNKGFL